MAALGQARNDWQRAESAVARPQPAVATYRVPPQRLARSRRIMQLAELREAFLRALEAAREPVSLPALWERARKGLDEFSGAFRALEHELKRRDLLGPCEFPRETPPHAGPLAGLELNGFLTRLALELAGGGAAEVHWANRGRGGFKYLALTGDRQFRL